MIYSQGALSERFSGKQSDTNIIIRASVNKFSTTAVTSMRIPTELNERYSRLAKETGRSRSFYVNEALQEAIDRFEYEYGILKDIEDYRAGRLETYSIDEVRAHCGLAN